VSDIILPPGWPRPSGYAQGVVASGRILTVSGQIGWNESNQLVGPAFLEQALQALRNIVAVVRAAGGGPEHLMRLTWFVVDCSEYRAALQALGDGYREIVGSVYPAMTLVQVAALLEEGARVEIEATAVLPGSTSPGGTEKRAEP
jgi:enamine deaminase RidA (YjgF/YER057c/UK114 family)